MTGYYQEDLAYIQAMGFSGFAEKALPFLLEKLALSLKPGAHILDIGCGAGVTTSALLAAGYEVMAVEPSSALVRYAREAAPAARFLRKSVYEADLPDCDAAIAIGESLTYHPDPSKAERSIRDFFANARHALSKDGILVFDFISNEGESLSGRAWASGGDWAVLAETEDAPPDNYLIRRIETFRADGELYRRACETHVVRLFAEQDIRQWLEAEGFKAAFGDAYGSFALPPRRRMVVATPT